MVRSELARAPLQPRDLNQTLDLCIIMAPSATGPAASTTKSGITTGQDGERHIPSSKRPDGTVRKEIRVRPGYRPPEDVEVYKNRTAESWKSRDKQGVPGAEAVEKENSASAANKNAKRREARKKAAADKGDEPPVDKPGATTSEDITPVDPAAERVKEARKLSKKLRQARELRDKKDQGDTLLPEQFEKVIKINELIRQLDKLGFDAEGEEKTASP